MFLLINLSYRLIFFWLRRCILGQLFSDFGCSAAGMTLFILSHLQTVALICNHGAWEICLQNKISDFCHTKFDFWFSAIFVPPLAFLKLLTIENKNPDSKRSHLQKQNSNYLTKSRR